MRVGPALIRMLVIVWLVTAMVFIALRLTPGDPALLLLGPQAGRADNAERLEALRERYGLNEPVLVQYGIWLGDLLQGDLGESNRSGRPVLGLVLGAAPVTISLIGLSILVSIPVAVFIGSAAARRRSGWVDRLVRSTSAVAMAIPAFWVGLVLLVVFSVYLGWLPASGYVSPLENPFEFVRRMVMPVFTLSLFLVGLLLRFVYTETADVLEQDYIQVATAMGVRRRTILYLYAAKNALTPMIIVIGVEMGTLIGGAVLVEEVFGLPGMGRLLLNSVLGRDYQIVQGTVVIVTVVVVILNFLAEMAYRRLDPRLST